MPHYHQGNRDLQDDFGSRALADRLADRLGRVSFNETDTAFIAAQSFFFLATAGAWFLTNPPEGSADLPRL